MEFIDHTGHIFSMKTYSDDPVALKYKEGDYVFWISKQPVSVNNYYILPVRFLIEYNKIKEVIGHHSIYEEGNSENWEEGDPWIKISVESESSFYKLISAKHMQEKMESLDDLKRDIELNYMDFKDSLGNDDFYYDEHAIEEAIESGNASSQFIKDTLLVDSESTKYVMFPFYIVGKSDVEGTYLSNLMIHVKYKHEIEGQTMQVELTQDQMYNYLMQQTFSDIDIYEVHVENGNFIGRSLWYTIPSGYNPSTCEIIKHDDESEWYRILNWGRSSNTSNLNPGMPADVYHYIVRLPEDKWLQAGHYYQMSGHVYRSCRACGGVIWINHDYNLYIGNNPENGYFYGDRNSDFKRATLRNLGNGSVSFGSVGVGGAFDLNESTFMLTTNVRDIWFDTDNKAVVDNTSGGYVTVKMVEDVDEWTPITVGCTFIDECEELVINGKNLGISLPKDIIRAIYQARFNSKWPDEKLFKKKVKELLLNYMQIFGECGNMKSMKSSLEWFGWGDKVSLNKLLRTDNEFQKQFIIDSFDIGSSLKETYRAFRTTNMISLSVPGNHETGEVGRQDYSSGLIGEGKPLLESYFNKMVEVTHDDWTFYKPYYDFIMNELALKLDCMRHYYEKYFLPVHMKISRASVEWKVYANDMKLQCHASQSISARYVSLFDNDVMVEFPSESTLLYKKSTTLIDSKFNVFKNYNEEYENEDLYYVNENCIEIPIKIYNINSQFSKSDVGDWIIGENGNMTSISSFYKIVQEDGNDEYVKTTTEEATHYMLPSVGIVELQQDRYAKVSSALYKVVVMLTYVMKTQDPNGDWTHYNGSWYYTPEDRRLGNYVCIEGGKTKYNVKNYNVLSLPKDRYTIRTGELIVDNKFTFYQTPDNEYKGILLIPRLLGLPKDIDWLKTDFRVIVGVNGNWFTYDFNVTIPNLYIDLGKLQYRYNITTGLTKFSQIKSIDKNKVYFNSFMYQPDLVTIDALFYDDTTENEKVMTFIDKMAEIGNSNAIEYNMMQFYSKYYRGSISIPQNKSYYNRIHLFKLYKTDTYPSKRSSQEIPYSSDTAFFNLYYALFNKMAGYDFVFKIDEKVEYDAYLMHDKDGNVDQNGDPIKPYWYIVLISKYPIGMYNDKSLLDMHKIEYSYQNYSMKYTGYSIDKFLVNRMDIVMSNGNNHFNQDDLIIASVNNNDYRFNIDLTSKWMVKKTESKSWKEKSNQQTMVVPTEKADGTHYPGYYDIMLNYSINGLADHQYKSVAQYRVNKENVMIEYPHKNVESYNDGYFVEVTKQAEEVYTWEEKATTTMRYINQSNEVVEVELELSGTVTNVQIKNGVGGTTNLANTIYIEFGTDVEELAQGALAGIYGAGRISNPGCEVRISHTITRINDKLIGFEGTTLNYPTNGSSCIKSFKVHPDNPVFDSRENCGSIVLTNDDPGKEHTIGYSGGAKNSGYGAGTLLYGSQTSFFPDSINEIGDYAFYSIKNLAFIEISNNIEYIGIQAFGDMTDLNTIVFGTNLKRIHVSAFANQFSSSRRYGVNLKYVFMRSETPPYGINDNSAIQPIWFSVIPSRIYVEPGYARSYKADPVNRMSLYSGRIYDFHTQF